MNRNVVVGIVVAGVLVLAGAGVAWWLLSRPPGPDETARDYLRALAAGDAGAALDLVLPPSGDDVDRTTALEGAEELLADPNVESVGSPEGGETRAEVTFTLGGDERSASFGLVERDGRWFVSADGLGSLQASTTLGDTVLVGGAPVSAGAVVTLLPALYPVAAAPPGILAGTTDALVMPGETTQTQVEASITPDAVALAQEQIDAYAEMCASASDAVPENCGLRVPWAADLASLTSIAFRIDRIPQVSLAPDLRSFAATDGVIVATATGAPRDGGGEGSFTYRAEDWALRGSVTLTAEGMQLAVD